MNTLVTLLSIFSFTLLTACADLADSFGSNDANEPITPAPNHKILFEAAIIRTGAEVVVDVVLRDSRNDDAAITIAADERLVFNSGGAETELLAEEIPSVCNTTFGWTFCSEVHYRALINAAELSSDRLQIKYQRPDFGDVSGTYVDMPVAVELLSPLADESYSRVTQPITVSWNNPKPGTFVEVQALGYVNELAGDYFQYDTRNSADNGIHLITEQQIQPSNRDIKDQAVRLTIYVGRSSSGVIDSGYGGGSIRALNQSTVTINSLP